MYNYHLLTIFLVCLINNAHFVRMNGTIYWWKMEPYTFIGKNGKPTGIMIDIEHKMSKFCPVYRNKQPTYQSEPFKDYSSFLETLKGAYFKHLKKSKSKLDLSATLWFPVISPDIDLRNTSLRIFNIFKTNGAFFIVKRDVITLHRRLGVGFSQAYMYIILGNLLAVCFGVTVQYLVSAVVAFAFCCNRKRLFLDL